MSKTITAEDALAIAGKEPDRATTKKTLVFDGDGAQYLPCGKPCSLCGIRQTTDDALVFIRVRERRDGQTEEVAHVCPECVARMFLQVTRLDLWRFVSGNILSAIRRMLNRRKENRAVLALGEAPAADEAEAPAKETDHGA